MTDSLLTGDCGVCIGTDNSDLTEFWSSETVTARKAHKCCECRLPILPGQNYERSAGISDGEMWSHKTCLLCQEIRDAMRCSNGFYYECLWEEMRDYVFPEMTTGCLDRLKTVAAKQFLIERWKKWKGL